MKAIKHILGNLFIGTFLALMVISCQEEDVSPKAILVFSEPQGKLSIQTPRESQVSFQIKANPQSGKEIEYVRVLASYGDNAVEYKEINSFPIHVKVSLQQLLPKLQGLHVPPLDKGAQIALSFAIKLKSGQEELLARRILLPITCQEWNLEGTYAGTTEGISGPGGGGAFSTDRTRNRNNSNWPFYLQN